MLISDFAIKRPMITIVAMVALVGFGLIALLKLQTDEFPDVAPPVVTVGLVYPGASPDGVEREILDPIEEYWATQGKPEQYAPGTWGPASADAMMARDGRTWRRP